MAAILPGKPPRAVVGMSVPDTSAPTPEFRQHHDVLKPRIDKRERREYWEVSGRFSQLDPDEPTRDAARRFRHDWDVGMEGVRDKTGALVRTDWTPYRDRFSDHQIDAVTRLSELLKNIEHFQFGLTVACLVHDAKWAELARSLGYKDYRTAKKLVRAALASVVKYCEDCDAHSASDRHEGLPDPPKPGKLLHR